MKNYKVYLKKINSLAGVYGIKIENFGKEIDNKRERGKLRRKVDSSIEDCGECDAARRKIYISSRMNNPAKIATMLHELGHFYDTFHKPDSCALTKAYIKYLKNKKLTKREKHLILECEKSAWNQAKNLAAMLKIPTGKWFDKERKAGLQFYNSLR